LLDKHLQAKESKKHQAKLSKEMLKGIVYGTPDKYYTLSWKGHTIETLRKHPQGTGVLKAKILQLRSEGHKILNTNINDLL
jgi:hypothetical protein